MTGTDGLNSSTSALERLRDLLGVFEARIDLDRVARVRDRHRLALRAQVCVPPPLVCEVAYDGAAGPVYPVREAIDDPVKMLVNELLVGFTAPLAALDRQDDTPLCVRANVGTGVIASMFGAQLEILDDNPPWVRPLASETDIERAASGPLPEVDAGLGERVRAHYEFFHDILAAYPRCGEAFDITLPDLQGPLSTAEMLWGSEIYIAMRRRPQLVRKLLDRVTEQTIRVAKVLAPLRRDRLAPVGGFQHATGVPGQLLVRNDSLVLISASMYRDIVEPYDVRIAEALGGVAVHFCGDGAHQAANLFAAPGIRGLDFGQAHLMDQAALYAAARECGAVVARLRPSREDLVSGVAAARYPLGANFCYSATDAADAQDVSAHYYGNALTKC